MDRSTNKFNNVIFILITILSIFGMIGIDDLRIFGMVITPYRIAVPILFLICAFKYLQYIKSDNDHKKITKSVITITGIFILWIIYGTVQLFAIDGLSMKNGIKELFDICLGYAVVISLCIVVARGLRENIIINTVKIVYILIILLAAIEIALGYHLPMSIYADSISAGILSTKNHSIVNATAIFYNPNDLAAFIAIFAPFFFYSRSLKERIVNIVVLFIILGILRLNDAWIAMFSVGISLAVFVVVCIVKRIRENVSGMDRLGWDAGITVIAGAAGYFFGFKVLLFFRKIVHHLLETFGIDIGGIDDDISVSGFGDTIDAQLISGTGNSGSSRIETYVDMVRDTFVDSHGLGFGPDGYTYYVRNNSGTEVLVNPHCLWLEILSQYGVILFGIIIAAIVYLYISLFKIYIKNKSTMALLLFLMDTSFVFAVFGPSTFLGYGYSWIIVGLSAGYVAKHKLNDKRQMGKVIQCD